MKICTRYYCLVRTCSKHRCHRPPRARVEFEDNDDCDLYITPYNLSNLDRFLPLNEEGEEIEDDFI
jgi:hypothetical protein